jgi:cytidylate kinase
MALVSYKQAKNHLRLPDDESKADVLLKIEQASALVLARLERSASDSPAWDEDTDPTTDAEFSQAQAMVLLELTALWRFRGDDDETPVQVQELGRLSARAERIAARLKGPTLA